MAMITQVFTCKGQHMPLNTSFLQLVQLNPKDIYSKQKAAGSLGGASNSGFIKRTGNDYLRTR